MAQARIVVTPHGGEHLHFNGYIYHKHETRNEKTYWRCSQRRTHACHASTTTQFNGEHIDVIKEGEHQHPHVDEEETSNECESSHDSNYEEDGVSNLEEEAIGISDEEDSSEEEGSSDEEDDAGAEGVWESWQEDSDDEQNEFEDGEEVEDEDDGNETGEEDEGCEKGQEANSDMTGIELLYFKIKRYRHMLGVLRQARPAMREAILKSAEKGLICLLCEICWNIVGGQINFSVTETNLLRPFSEHILDLSSKEMGWEEKRDCLAENAEDAFIPILLNVVWPYIK